MTDFSVSRSGYSNRRSPAALAAATILNGGIIALLIAIPAVIVTPAGDPPLRIRFIELSSPPPPVADPPKPAPSKVDVKATPRPADPLPIAVDPFVELMKNPPYTGTVTPPVFPGKDEVLTPVKVKGWYHSVFRAPNGEERMLSIDQLLRHMGSWM